LKYPILSDQDGAARKAYAVGKAFFGMAEGRETFFIDAKGIVRGVYVKNLGFQ
jgi:peroxiredoxin Q/BCP